MMTNKTPADALSIATLCDTKASELRESLPTIAQAFTDAGNMIRAQHQALTAVTCQHMITFTVTKEMNDSGRDAREPGKYCMTCGVLVPKPPKPKKDKPTNESGDEASDNLGEHDGDDDDQET
jgi:hypothetical protein